MRGKSLWLAGLILGGAMLGMAQDNATEKYPALPSETPNRFQPPTAILDYVKREEMIPMRDGVKLYTVIIVPKGAKDAGILLTRTPYNADDMTNRKGSTHIGPILQGYDNVTDVIEEDGYIRVVQDIRGKYNSEGDYVMNRPMVGPLNPTPVDESTDTYDTIEWLVKNVPESNGKVGILGISYDGFLALTPLFHPHPALKVAVPMKPLVDGWMGDDWFHNGAFRQPNLVYMYEQEATRDNKAKWPGSYYDEWNAFMSGTSAGQVAHEHGMEQLGFWQKVAAHPAYDNFWKLQAMDKLLAAEPLQVPTMLVHSEWDQEDIYGAPAVYKAVEPKDKNNNMLYLVMGPWHHGGEIGDGSSLGPLRFGTDTALYFREHILRPFLAQYLKDGAPKAQVAPVEAYETGTDRWLHLNAWPSGCDQGCEIRPTPLYLAAENKAGFAAPTADAAAYDEYISDPANPVNYRPRPIAETPSNTWRDWLVTDQRNAESRPDVVTYSTGVLTEPVKIAGQPVVNLIASTSGTDSDWVVKLIDVYPPEVASQPEMGGYELMISADIFRGRYREGYDNPKPIAPDKPLLYKWTLPTANHVFLPGHRIMVQIQSSWFPLYDRNPQTYVSNIFFAKPGDYKKAVQRIYHSPTQASFIELPLVKMK